MYVHLFSAYLSRLALSVKRKLAPEPDWLPSGSDSEGESEFEEDA